jgi:peptidoglycan/LPS O-acetylase OafA/YrhL
MPAMTAAAPHAANAAAPPAVDAIRAGTAGQGRIEAVDYLRGIAALSVLGFHYFFSGVNSGKISSLELPAPVMSVARYGYLGVELFFLISGFVVAASAQGKTARQFAVGRAVRLYPTFWLAVGLTAGVALAIGEPRMRVTAGQVLANLTMLPGLFGQSNVDGVYWTLALELQFYALVFLLLLLGWSGRLLALFPWWAMGMLALSLLWPAAGEVPYLGGYFALFASGGILADVRARGMNWVRLTGLAAGFLVAVRHCVAGAATMGAATGVDYSGVVVVIVVALLYLVMLGVCAERVTQLRLPYSSAVGAVTYPLYLLHAHIGYMVLSRWADDSVRWWAYPTMIAGVVALAGLLELAVRRTARTWHRWFDRTLGAAVGAIAAAIDACSRAAAAAGRGRRPRTVFGKDGRSAHGVSPAPRDEMSTHAAQ